MIVARDSGSEMFVRTTDGCEVNVSVRVDTQAAHVIPVISKRVVVNGPDAFSSVMRLTGVAFSYAACSLTAGGKDGWNPRANSESGSKSLYLISRRRISKSSHALMMRLMKYAVKTQQAILHKVADHSRKVSDCRDLSEISQKSVIYRPKLPPSIKPQ